jgi:hypothetical protein
MPSMGCFTTQGIDMPVTLTSAMPLLGDETLVASSLAHQPVKPAGETPVPQPPGFKKPTPQQVPSLSQWTSSTKLSTTAFSTDAGFGVQVTGSQRFEIDKQTDVTIGARVRTRMPDDAAARTDVRVFGGGEWEFASNAKLGAQVYGQIDTPWDGSSPSLEVSARGYVDYTHDLTSELSANVTAGAEYRWGSSDDAALLQAGGRLTYAEPNSGIKLFAGADAEQNILDTASPGPITINGGMSKALSESVTATVQGNYSVNGNDSSNPNAVHNSGDGSWGVVGKLDLSW